MGRYVTIPTAVRFLKRFGRTELLQALLDPGEELWQISRLWWFGWSPQFFGFTCVVERQLDLTSVTVRLRGTCTLSGYWFLVVCRVLAFSGDEVEVIRLGDQLLRWCAREACGLGFAVVGQTSSVFSCRECCLCLVGEIVVGAIVDVSGATASSGRVANCCCWWMAGGNLSLFFFLLVVLPLKGKASSFKQAVDRAMFPEPRRFCLIVAVDRQSSGCRHALLELHFSFSESLTCRQVQPGCRQAQPILEISTYLDSFLDRNYTQLF
ncbi:hypothetical protein Taro_013802 [Colocasia esculenta]|uniref:Uncharacterized protein n=1 Tax=Colocasia esculenta TaxID=4460 RepID=A0A843U7E4_COLES|nr:hypothetical protein [Colocasia esculenta]